MSNNKEKIIKKILDDQICPVCKSYFKTCPHTLNEALKEFVKPKNEINPCNDCEIEQWQIDSIYKSEWIATEFCQKRCKFYKPKDSESKSNRRRLTQEDFIPNPKHKVSTDYLPKENKSINDIGDFFNPKEQPKDSDIIYAKESFMDLQKMLEQQKIIIGGKNEEIGKCLNEKSKLRHLVADKDKEIEQLRINHNKLLYVLKEIKEGRDPTELEPDYLAMPNKIKQLKENWTNHLKKWKTYFLDFAARLDNTNMLNKLSDEFSNKIIEFGCIEKPKDFEKSDSEVIKELKTQNHNWRVEVGNLDKEIELLKKTIEDSTFSFHNLEAEFETIGTENDKLKSELKRGREIVSTQLDLGTKLVAQRNQALEKARVALTEEDFAEIVEILEKKS